MHVEVRTPTKLDEEQERLLRELASIRNEEVSIGNVRTGLFARMRDALGGNR